MLDLIRNYRGLFSIVFVISAIGLIVSMFGSPTGAPTGGSLTSSVVARVGSEKITIQDLARQYQQQIEEAEAQIEKEISQASNKAEMRKFYNQVIKNQFTPERVLEGMIQQSFLAETAKDLRSLSSPAAVRHFIEQYPDFLKDGKFSIAEYRTRVSSPGLFEDRVSRAIAIQNLENLFVSALSLNTPESRRLDKLLEEQRRLETLSISSKNWPTPNKVDKDTVDAFLASPESNAKLEAAYQKNIGSYKTEEEIKARHILIKEDKGGETFAKQLLADIGAGKTTFEAAAKEHSADTFSAQKGGVLDFFKRGVMDPAFEKAAFDLKNAGDRVEAPVKSQFGYHLIELVDRKAATERPLSDVRAELAQIVLLEEAKQNNLRSTIEAWIKSGRLPTDADLKKLGLTSTWQQTFWKPTEPMLGSTPVGDTIGELIALSSQNPVLSRTLTQGDQLVLVRWIPNTANAAPPALNDATDVADLGRSQKLFSEFLKFRFDQLEKNKKVRRYEDVVAQLRQDSDETSSNF